MSGNRESSSGDRHGLLGLAFDRAPQAMLVVDASGEIRKWNRAASALFHIAAREALGRRVGELILHALDGATGAAIALAVGRGRAWTGRGTVTGGAAAGLAVEVTVTPIGPGSPPPALLIVRDATAAALAEREASVAAALFTAFMAASPVVAFIKDADGRYVFANRHLLSTVGDRMGPDWRDKTDAEVWPADVAARVRANDRAVLAAGTAIAFEQVMPHADGPHTYIVHKFPIETLDGPSLLGGVGIDITDRVRAEDGLRRSEALLARAEAAARMGSWEWDGTGSPQWSDEMFRILGLDPVTTTLDGETLYQVVHPEDRGRVREAMGAAFADATPLDLEFRIVRPDGTMGVVHTRGQMLADEQGRPVRTAGVAQDVTERRRAELELLRLGTAIEQSAESVLITDASGTIQYVNPAFERVTGYSRDEVIGQNPRILKSGVQPPAFYESMWRTLTRGDPWIADFVNRRKDGSLIVEEQVISPIRDADGAIRSYVSVKRDVTRERRTEEQAERLVHERALVTRALSSLTPEATPEATAADICRAIVGMPDVSWAAVNALEPDGSVTRIASVASGGRAPDLRRLSRARAKELRARSERGPWVEDWTGSSQPYPEAATSKIRGAAYVPLGTGSGLVGMLVAGTRSEYAAEVLADRLAALLEFAAVGHALLGPGLAARAEVREAGAAIDRVLVERAYSALYQPILDLDSRVVVGYEALIRFADGTPPDTRLRAARAAGRGVDLDMACLEAALRDSASLPDDAWLNVNVTPGAVLAREPLQSLLRSFDRRFVLEVTEHEAITDYGAFRAAIAGLRPDVRLAVDDAGAGFASFRHILELEPDIVKLDRSLVAGVDADPARRALAAGVRSFAESVGCELIAEGIETEAEVSTLLGLGIRRGQGYLLGRPAPAADPGFA